MQRKTAFASANLSTEALSMWSSLAATDSPVGSPDLGTMFLPARDAERRNHRLARSHEICARTFGSDAAATHSRAFNQENERIGEQLRPRCARGSAQSRQTVALADLEFFDHPQPRMAFFGQFDRSVRKVAATLVLRDKFRSLLDKAVKLADWISRVAGLDLRPYLVGLPSLIIQILENKIVLRTEVAIERHLIGACRLGDGVDANTANAAPVEQILRAHEDPLTRSPHAEVRREGEPLLLRIFLRHGS